jgi:aminopeptidase
MIANISRKRQTMKDKRNGILAGMLINYSVSLKPGEKIMVEIKGKDTLELGKEIIREATRVGGIPFWYYNDESLQRPWIRQAGENQFRAFGKLHLRLMKEFDAYLGLRGSDNPFDLADIPPTQTKLNQKLFYKPVHLEQRVKRTRWCVLRFPNNAMAQLAETSQEAFEKFYYDVCCLDYAKMSKAMDPLVKLFGKTDMVRIVGPDTDLSFSIRDIPVVKCDGKRNIPDGEVYTAPVRDSVNGHITYNTPALHNGITYKNIRFGFRNGKIIDAACGGDLTRKLNDVLDTDPGARYIGEFALGLNPFIRHPMKDTLFDEKIAGSFHLTPGQCYDEAPNGNRSAIHWDLVVIQRKDYGGGEIYFDDKLIRKNGLFVDKKLEMAFSARALRGRMK